MAPSNNPFNVIGNKVQEYQESQANARLDIDDRIKNIISSSDIVLFMKGNSSAPQCGFSANTVQILNTFDRPYKTFDVLSNPEIRQAVKEFSNWPTFPQLYIKGKLVGGNDIITEMHQNGDLQDMMKDIGSN